MKKIKIFCCQNCISDEDINSIERCEVADIRLIKLPCSGRLEVLHMLEAFETGSDGVIVLTCLNGKCQGLVGNKRARNRVELAKKYLDEIGLGQGRLLMKEMGLDEDVQSTVDEMIVGVGEMGRLKAGRLSIASNSHLGLTQNESVPTTYGVSER